MSRSLKELATEALKVQNASNLRGVVTSFSNLLTDMAEHVTSSDALAYHPIVRLYNHKIASLSSVETIDLDMYKKIEEQCKQFLV